MKIYIDSEFKCHVTDDGTMRETDVSFFDNKCAAYIEGYRFVPSGEQWIREDGTVFIGEMIAPWKPWEELDKAQSAYERQRVAELEEENEALLADMAQMIEEVYNSDLEMMGL